MNWFRRHLNWTLLLAIVASAALVLQFIPTLPAVAEVLLWPWLIFVVFVSGWTLRQKGQSLFHLFWWLLGWIGVVVIVCLRNKNEVAIR